MAVDLTALATAAQYRATSGDKATATDATLNAQLAGCTRALERALHVAPGGFLEHEETYVFPSIGGARLWLRDSAGMGYFLQSVDAGGIGIDTSGDGGFDDYTWDLDDAWVSGLPENAALQGEPYRSIEILGGRSSSLSSWPAGRAVVRIAGTWGFPTASQWMQLLADLVVHRTKELRDAAKAGPTGELETFEGSVPLGRQSAWMYREIESLVGRRLPVGI